MLHRNNGSYGPWNNVSVLDIENNYVVDRVKLLEQVSESGKPGRFRDNDGLAALLATQLKADLLLLCTDVNGVYTSAPGLPGSELLPTYSPQVSCHLVCTLAHEAL